jgi:hypothetical protein
MKCRRRPPRKRTSSLFVAWGAVPGRSDEIAKAIGGDALCCFPPSASRNLSAPVRWLLSALQTSRSLLALRPEAIVVTNPPIFAALVCFAWSRAMGCPIVLDDHPGSFGTHGDRVARRFMAVHRWIVPRCAACLVTAKDWSRVVEQWGGRSIVLHESPYAWDMDLTSTASAADPVRALFVCTFSEDEPAVEAVLGATLVPDVSFEVTGDLRRRPATLESTAAPNICYLGLLEFSKYQQKVLRANVVVALTTEPTSAMRAAFEGVWAEKQLVLSDWPLLRQLFPHAIFVENTPDGIARGLRSVVSPSPELAEVLRQARLSQLEHWHEQVAALRAALRR